MRAAADVVKALRTADARTADGRPEHDAAVGRFARRFGLGGYGTVPAREVDLFLREPSPRRIPPAVKAAAAPSRDPTLIFFGITFCLLPLVIGVPMLLFPGADPVVRLLALIPAALMTIGLLLLGIPAWKRWQVTRLLRDGEVAAAKLISLDRAGGFVGEGGQQRRGYVATFAFEIDRRTLEGTEKLTGRRAQRAAALLESGEPTRVLVRPEAPGRVFWIDGIVAA